MKGMNHSLKVLADKTLESFMIPGPLPPLGTAGVRVPVDQLDDRPILTMVPYHH